MLKKIKKMLQDMHLSQRISTAKTLDDATQLMKSIDAKITDNDLLSLIQKPGFILEDLNEADLLSIAGGRLTTKCTSGCTDTQ